MFTPLQRHDEPGGAEDFRVKAEAERSGPATLALRYRVQGDPAALRLPSPQPPERTDELWRHTCFEVFVATPGGGYLEFNFAPSTQWAAYRFDGYRAGMAALDVPAPRIEARVEEGRYELSATAVLDHLPDLPHDAAWRVALSAVIEGTDGRRSYWALAHPSAQPDFHHPESFRLSLSSPARR
jgi:hypothetical protein